MFARKLPVVDDNVNGLERPKTRGDCVNGLRPCPFVGCRYSLVLELEERRTSKTSARAELGVRATWPDRDIDQIPETCALDVADRGGSTFEEIASVMNISNERAQQIVRKALWRSDGPTRSLGLSDVSQECARQTGEAPNARCMGSDPEQGCGQPRGRKA